jgi:uncharacterized protein YkwD
MKNWIRRLPFTAGVFCALTAQAQVSPPTAVVYLSQDENQFYQLINQFRAQLNLPQLQIHVALETAAQKYSVWLASTDFLTHYGPAANETPFQRMALEGYTPFTYAGENIACGNGDAVATFRQFAFSPDHLDNMISPHFHHVGISRSGTGQETCPYYWVDDFGSMTDLTLDPPDMRDLSLITQAIEAVAGPLNGSVVALPTPDPSVPMGMGTPIPSLLPISISTPVQTTPSTLPSVTPNLAPATAPNTPSTSPTTSDNVVASGNFSVIQCTVPYALGKGLFAFSPNLDTVLNILNTGTGFNAQITYYENGQLANVAGQTIYGVNVSKAENYPLFDIFSAPGPRVNGFIIEYDSQKGSAQFTPYLNNGTGAAGDITCSVKY